MHGITALRAMQVNRKNEPCYCLTPFRPQPESAENLKYMRLLDEEYTRHPFYGVPKMTVWLQEQG